MAEIRYPHSALPGAMEKRVGVSLSITTWEEMEKTPRQP